MRYLIIKRFKSDLLNKIVILSVIITLILISVTACFYLYIISLYRYIGDTAENTLNTLIFSFNPEYQWKKDDFYTPYSSDDFNSDGSMDKYNVPAYVDRELFDGFADPEYVERYGLGFVLKADNVFNIDSGNVNEDEVSFFEYNPGIFTENLIYGASFEDFVLMSCGIRQTGTGFLKVDITEGREHGDGECLICGTTAKKYGYNIGDRIIIKSGERAAEVTISGFFTYSNGSRPEEACEEYAQLRIQHTNPWFRIKNQVMRYMVITDFDTAYGLIPEGRHEINSYIACYELYDYRKAEEFIASQSGGFPNSWMMRFVPDEASYNSYTEAILNGLSVMRMFAVSLCSVTVIVTILLTVFSTLVRMRETGILYGIGIRKSHLMILNTVGTAGMLFPVSAVSIFLGYLFANIITANNEYFSSLGLSFPVDLSTVLTFISYSAAGGIIAFSVSGLLYKNKTPAVMLGRR